MFLPKTDSVPGVFGAIAVLLSALSLAACSRPEPRFSLHDITGLMPRLEFTLTDGDDKAVSAQNFRGKVVLLYFGYTECPDACPTTLATLQHAVRLLGSQAANIRVLFVTVDPQRDTAAVLRRYVSYFGPQFVGLRGDDTALNALTRRYRVAYHREVADANGYYSVDHSNAVFVFDPSGRPRLLADSTAGAKTIASDLSRLLASG
ncbi:MAG TPA: SCO family protein [Steroidobacteraceae bacterium]